MIPCTCIVQAGQISTEAEATLRTDLESFSQDSFSDSAHISWITVPEHSGFTAGKPSTSVLVSLESNRPLQRTDRAELLKQLCDIWIKGADRAMHEVVASIRDPKK